MSVSLGDSFVLLIHLSSFQMPESVSYPNWQTCFSPEKDLAPKNVVDMLDMPCREYYQSRLSNFECFVCISTLEIALFGYVMGRCE